MMIYLNKDHNIKDKYEDSDWIKTPLVIFLNNTYDLLVKKEVIIDDESHIGANSVIVAGVHIGKRCQIGAGSVVTKNIPDNSFAAGNPCKVIRKIIEKDSLKYRKDLY